MELIRTMVFAGLVSSGFWFFSEEVMFFKVGFLFSGVGWCFPEWVFHFRTVVPILQQLQFVFGAQAFLLMGFGREGEEDCGICFGAQALIVVVCWWVQGDDMACHMWKLCKKLWEMVWHQNYPSLEQLHHLVHNFFHFAHLKSTFFYFTHLFLQNTHISLSIVHIYSNKIFISLPTQPPTHTHNPHWYHIEIHTTHQQKTRKTNPAKWIKTHTHNPHWYRTTIHTTQQKTRKTNPAKWIKTHTHNPHRYHTRIHTTHRRKTRKTNPAKWIKTHTQNPH